MNMDDNNLLIIEDSKVIGVNKDQIDREYDWEELYIDIPEGITEIEENAFSHLGEIYVVFPSTLEKIGNSAFSHCSLNHDEELVFPNSLQIIGENAFEYCELENVVLNDGLEVIGDFAFSNNNIKKIIIPSTVKKIGIGAFCCPDLFRFSNYDNIENIIVDKSNKNYYIENGCLIEKETGSVLCFFDNSIENLQVPYEINNIEDWAFSFRTNLKSVKLHFNVEKIGYCAFMGCENLDFTIPWEIRKIGEGALTEVKSITIEDGACVYEEDGCIYDLDGTLLTYNSKSEYVSIPYDIKRIGNFAFAHNPTIKSLTMNKWCDNIGRYAFYRCKNLTDIDFCDGLEQIEECAFLECSNLKNLYLPRSLNTIGSFAFHDCLKLGDVLIPDLLLNMGRCVFGTRQLYVSGNINIYINGWISNNWDADWCKSTIPVNVRKNIRFSYSDGIPDFWDEGIEYDESIRIEKGYSSYIHMIGSVKLNQVVYDEIEDTIDFYIDFSHISSDTEITLNKIEMFHLDENYHSITDEIIKKDEIYNKEYKIQINQQELKKHKLIDSLDCHFEFYFTIKEYLGKETKVCLWFSDKEDIEINKIRKLEKGKILYIYKGNIKCRRNLHRIISATAILYNQTDNEIEINVEYCTECKKYLLEYGLFERYRNRYGVLIGNFRMITNGIFDGEYDLALESPLRLSGYNVSQKDDFSSDERHYILARIIHDKIMSKNDVIRYLSYFIRMNGARYGNELAVEKWEEDLTFVQEYDISIQPRTIISKIKKY